MLAKEEGRKPQKGGGKKRRHPGEDGKGGERKKRAVEEGEKGQGDGGRKRLDALSVGYFRRVGERLSEGFEDNEEREMFVENVLSEVKGKATLVAMDRTGSITLQRLLPLSSPEQVGEVLAELGGESGSEFKAVSCDRCGGHVVESAIRQMSRWMDLSQKEPSAEEEEEEEETCGVLEAQRLTASLAKYKLFLRLFDELVQGLEAILAAVPALKPESQNSSNTSSLHIPAHLWVCYHSGPAEGATGPCPPFVTMVPGWSELARFKGAPSSSAASPLNPPPPDLLFGLRPQQATVPGLITTSQRQGRGKILQETGRITGHMSSRRAPGWAVGMLEAIWNSASVSQRPGTG
ncbi:nucleolar protein 9 [Lates japonicus]|uniref:Nucleolar protein 9 n=1 Tax=Lates japonicus TaxID=270547 RepID=A0AAD3MCH2_LATJO|nr:nucleolar protein 9 [Lates japonicus]